MQLKINELVKKWTGGKSDVSTRLQKHTILSMRSNCSPEYYEGNTYLFIYTQYFVPTVIGNQQASGEI
jgi:hypothetical protein